MHVQRKAVVVCAAVGGICTFLPWATMPLFGSVNGSELDGARGWISLALCAGVLLGVLCGSIGDPLSTGEVFLCTLAGVGIGAIALWTIVEIQLADDFFGAGVGAGPYLLVVAGAAMVVLATRTTWHARTRGTTGPGEVAR